MVASIASLFFTPVDSGNSQLSHRTFNSRNDIWIRIETTYRLWKWTLDLLDVQKRTVFTSTGKADLGVFDKSSPLTPDLKLGPIRLLRGVQGRTGGYGLAHIESHTARIKQFEAMGFRDALDFVKFTVSNYDLVALQSDGRLLFQRELQQVYCQVICQWDEETKIWSVTTAIPKRASRHEMVIWKK